jgi:hypothetical protein
MYLLNKYFWIGSLERAIKTFVQALIAAFGVGQISGAIGVQATAIDWRAALSLAFSAALLSVLMSVGSGPIGQANSPSLVGAVPGVSPMLAAVPAVGALAAVVAQAATAPLVAAAGPIATEAAAGGASGPAPADARGPAEIVATAVAEAVSEAMHVEPAATGAPAAAAQAAPAVAAQTAPVAVS